MSRIKRFIGRVVNPKAHMEIEAQRRAIIRKKPRIRQLQNVNNALNAQRRGEYQTPDQRMATAVMREKARRGGYR